MSNRYFSPGLHQKLIDARQKGRALRAARLIREQSTCSPHSHQAHSSILKEIEQLVEDEKPCKNILMRKNLGVKLGNKGLKSNDSFS